MLGRALAKILGWALALLGGFFAVAGGYLALLGGSPYYVLTGLAMILSGALIGRGDERGRWLYVAIWVATLIYGFGGHSPTRSNILAEIDL